MYIQLAKQLWFGTMKFIEITNSHCGQCGVTAGGGWGLAASGVTCDPASMNYKKETHTHPLSCWPHHTTTCASTSGKEVLICCSCSLTLQVTSGHAHCHITTQTHHIHVSYCLDNEKPPPQQRGMEKLSSRVVLLVLCNVLYEHHSLVVCRGVIITYQ